MRSPQLSLPPLRELVPAVRTAAVVTAAVTVSGAVVGVIWPSVSPHIALVGAVNGSEATYKALLGDDVRLAQLGLVAGILSVGLLLAVGGRAARGSAAVLGLAVGGLLATAVAARVGVLVRQGPMTHEIRGTFPGVSTHSVHLITGYFGFRLRATGVYVVWPVTAVVLHALATRSWQPWRRRRPADDEDPALGRGSISSVA
jgi:hypothetical protein